MFSRLITNVININFYIFFFVFCIITLFFIDVVNSQSYSEAQSLSEKIDRLERIIIENSSNNKNIDTQETSFENLKPDEVEARLQAKVLQLEKLLENLTGQVEETRFELSQLKREIKVLNDDIVYRLSFIEEATGTSVAVSNLPSFNNSSSKESQLAQDNIEQGNVRLVPNPEMPLSSPVQDQPNMNDLTQYQQDSSKGNTMGILFTNKDGDPLPPNKENLFLNQGQVIEEMPEEMRSSNLKDGSNIISNSADNSIARELTLPNGTDKDQYNYAFEILRLANSPVDYERAETVLRAFLEKNPSSELAGNAQYWIGETFYVRSDFERAAVEFLAGYENYPTSVKGPDNLLKLGLSLARLEKKDVACASLSKLSTEYPSASETIKRRAQSERGNLKCN
ncbi:MAG: tol-pal system protein YbgF [Pseudomonadota bacterium]|nr:tol-pal system protein YbgF [Pseudomonadota bacterium]